MNTASAPSFDPIPAALLTPPSYRPVVPRGDHPDDYLENGRTYHGYRKGLYIAPCDDAEKDRLDMFHWIIYTSARNEELHRVPLTRSEGERPPLRILDVGCGTGIWAIEMADKYPDAEVIGIDLSLMQPAMVPNNLRFRRQDFESPWFMGENSWDMIRLGMLCGSVINWRELYHNCWRHLKPGVGHIEQVEIDFEPRCGNGTLPLDSEWRVWYHRYLTDATDRRDRPIAYNHNTPQLLRENGFVDVQRIKLKIPVGEWSRGHWALGRMMRVCLGETLEALSMAPFTRTFIWDHPTVKRYCEDVNKVVQDADIHAYNDL